MTKKLSKMTDEELDEHIAVLAEKRTAIRLEQNDAANELSIRQALARMNPDARRIVELQLEGGIRPEGEPDAPEGDKE